MEAFDAIVVGAGQAGVPLAVRLAESGLKTALVERQHLGGTCVNDGCTPTKTLVASARVAHLARRAAEFGVVLDGPVRVDMKAVKARKDAVLGESVKSLGRWIAGTAGLTLVRGHARFVGPHEMDVDGRRLQAPRIFLNTGARAVEPDWPGLAGSGWLSNRTLLDLDVLPEHLLIVGGSYIGLEFAQVYRRFGSRVTVVEHGPRIVSREDEDVSTAMREMLEGEGIRFVVDARGFAVERLPQGIALAIDGERIEASHLLVAVGRRPNTDELGIEAAGLALDRHGFVEVDDQLRTSVEGIWALGDVNGRGAFTHTSYNDFEIVAANLLDEDPRQASDRIPVYALFTDPPLARIGLNETQVRASGRPALVATMPMSRVGRARERGETTGSMKVLVDAESKRILGASLFGIEADEAIHALLEVMAADTPYTVVSRTMNIHPTVSELLPTLLQSLKPLK